MDKLLYLGTGFFAGASLAIFAMGHWLRRKTAALQREIEMLKKARSELGQLRVRLVKELRRRSPA